MRRFSIILLITSVTVPFFWAYFSASTYYEHTRQAGVSVCGLEALATVVRACLESCLMSAAAFILGVIAYRRIPFPRPLRRRVELASLALPLILCGGYAALILFA